MADIELVIRIDEEKYRAIKSNLYNTFPAEVKEWGLKAIRDGVPLDEVRTEIKQKARLNELGGRGNGKSIRYGLHMAMEIFDEYVAERKMKND